jgi:hypothetical protein
MTQPAIRRVKMTAGEGMTYILLFFIRACPVKFEVISPGVSV